MHIYYHKSQSESPRKSTIPVLLPIRAMPLILLKWFLQNISHGIMRILLRVMYPILNLFLHITLIFIVLSWPAIHYPIKSTPILGNWAKKCLAPPIYAELMVGRRHTREGDDPPTTHGLTNAKTNTNALHG